MKKLLFLIVIFTSIVTACGPTAEEKQALQKENEEMVNAKVDDILQSLDSPTEEVEVDTNAAIIDTASMEE